MHGRMRAYLLFIVFFTSIALSGCAAKRLGTSTTEINYNSFLQKASSKVKRTGLFIEPCEENDKKIEAEKGVAQPPKKKEKKGFFAKINPVNWFSKSDKSREEKEGTPSAASTTSDCGIVDMKKMVEQFNSIVETDEEKGILGDTVEQVRKRGFTIYLDKEEKTRRPNTEILYGDAALAAVGMKITPPQLQTPEEIERYKNYMKAHVAEVYEERDLVLVKDKLYINNYNALTVGHDYKFIIAFKNGRVFRRVIGGGPQNVPEHESSFLLGPGGFTKDALVGGFNRARDLVIPKP